MNQPLILAYLFFMGSVAGWVIELIFRRFFSSANPERKWINPGFCTGPWVPLYGLGLDAMYLIVSLEKYSAFESVFATRAALFLTGAAAMTAIEYIAGMLSLKLLHVRLWDYSGQWGNVQGIICPKFSAAWAALVAGILLPYSPIHPRRARLALAEPGLQLLHRALLRRLHHRRRQLRRTHSQAPPLRRPSTRPSCAGSRLKPACAPGRDAKHERAHFFRPFSSSRPLRDHLADILSDTARAAPGGKASRT